ncbi:MAG: CusA/CzcA family heavy metal efflux RND transporter [Clostridiales bacterium]|nr:CusA/CzcA family heavy metal efflux RND transporter [Clostridiales bacterium]
MIEKIVSFSLSRRTAVIFLLVLVVAWGVFSFLRIPIDAFPDVTNIQVEIICTASGLSPFEIERFVTYPLEMSMRGLPGLELMRSVTKFGISVLTLVFRDDVDIYFARQVVLERLVEAEKRMPAGAEVSLGPVSTAMGEVYQYTLEGKMPDDENEQVSYLTYLRTIQDWVVTPLLKSVRGVNGVNSFGGYIKQYHVELDPERLLQYDLSVGEVFEAIERNNLNVGGNIINRYSEQLIVRGLGLARSEDDLRNIVLKSELGVPVFVRDVADVKLGHAVRQGASLKDGQGEVVGGIVMMLRGENSRDVTRRVEAKVQEINSENILPSGLKIVPFYKRSDIIEQSLGTVTKAILEGAVLVLVVLSIFLGSVRGALIVIFALPLSALLTFIVTRTVNLPANLMSLGGIAISIGMIIDAAIIQVENVQRHLTGTEEEARMGDVLRAVLEVRKPSIFGELIIALTFVPILALQGIEGKMFSPLAITVAIALFSSLLLSIFVIPVFCFYLLRPGRRHDHFLLAFLRRIYLSVLRQGLRHRFLVLFVALILLAAALAIFPRLGTEFMPVMDEGAFDMDIQLLPGIALDEALRVTEVVEKKLMEFPELETIVSRTGQTGVALEARGVDKTGFVGALKPRPQWTSARSKDELFSKMREALSSVPGMAFGFSQPIQCRIDELVAGTRAQLIVKLFGEDLEILKAKANEIAGLLSEIRGTTDLIVERTAGQLYLSVHVDRSRIARFGLNVEDVLGVVEIAVGGKAATSLYEENKSFDVVLRFPEEKRSSLEAIKNILIKSPNGMRIPLSQLAEVSEGEGPVQISRENGERRIGIELNVSGPDIGGYVEEARQKIREKVAFPPGYYLAWGGQFENQQRAMRRLLVIAPLAVSLIFTLLFLTFRSLRAAGLVLLTLPLSLIGGVLGLYFSGLYLSVPASVGFIALFGIAVLNGIVLVSYISQLWQEGQPLEDAILEGCSVRLRPVLMTALITILSLTPLLFAQGPGSEIQRPLAVVVVGGLATSTLLTLIVLPVLYSFFEKRRR